MARHGRVPPKTRIWEKMETWAVAEALFWASALHISAQVGPRAMKILPEVPLAILKVTFFMVKVARTPLSSPKLEKGGDYSPTWWNLSVFLAFFRFCGCQGHCTWLVGVSTVLKFCAKHFGMQYLPPGGSGRSRALKKS